ncbi:HAD family hydrolase [Myxacorys almedinensis]|uniref:HAD-IA family hydrolase n=1 Tax=Myxacorys almedinensis A TaxID=2690445 RepID=A0A8J8CIK2_9CYAN|nr:HAD family hydrolase [Myxacorys almedinensis]NDJ16611.1 HAD-IA family hydrolase [Myxacorys almedinensis A]
MVTIYCNGIQFQHVQAIVFDKDGTLANSLGFLHKLGQNRAQAVAAELPGLEHEVLRCFGFLGETPSFTPPALNPAGLLAVGTRLENEIGVAALIAQTGRDWIEALAIARSAFQQADQELANGSMLTKADLTPPFEGIIDLVRSLRACALKLAILSSDSQTNVEEFVTRYDLAPYFQVLAGAHHIFTKPDAQLLHSVCTALETPAQNTLVIGDAIADIQLAAHGNALGSIGVTWGGVTAKQLASATAIAHTVSQIVQV